MDAGSWPKPANPSLLSSSIMHQPGSDTASKLEMSSLQEVWEKKKKKKSLLEITVTFLSKSLVRPN